MTTENFTNPSAKLAELGVAGAPAAGQGVALDYVGRIPDSLVAAPLLGMQGGDRSLGGANGVVFSPIIGVVAPVKFTRVFIWDDTAGGTVDVGIYWSDDESTFTRLVSSGAVTTLTGAGQRIIPLQIELVPTATRRFYFAVAWSGAGRVWSGVTLGTYLKGGVATTLPVTLTGMSVGSFGPIYLLGV